MKQDIIPAITQITTLTNITNSRKDLCQPSTPVHHYPNLDNSRN